MTDDDKLKRAYTEILDIIKDRPEVLLTLTRLFDEIEHFRLSSVDTAIVCQIVLGSVYMELGSPIGEEYFNCVKILVEKTRHLKPGAPIPPESIN